MADHYNKYNLKHFAGIVADCMELSLPETYAPGIPWVSDMLKERLGGPADKAILYHADAVGMHIWQKYTHLLAPVYKYTSMALPMESTIESVTPVAHATMYTGLDPEEHGIVTYTRPQLTCSTLYDELIKAGKKPAILCMADSSFVHIFKGRDMDYYEVTNATEIEEKALELIASDKYDVISIHTFDYDDAAHAFGPESKQGLNAVAHEAEVFQHIAEGLKQYEGKYRILLTYSPDHGQHEVLGGTGTHGSKMPEDMNIVHFFGTI